eukprot:TRINITY_DN4240_c0_g1_i21.p3 TRINITY_DN4240_c0_g1~~TRINITY_DN4240_c0_g1_i21.p3  ORF type:complete len:107 (-),score=19.04 TRINITY_DN4240_c0_g1_i21:87-407(-)
MKISYRRALSNKLGIAGIFLGLYCGFIIRDEYNYSSISRISDLIHNHDVQLNALNEERLSLFDRIKQIELGEKERKKALRKKTGRILGTKRAACLLYTSPSPRDQA